jgi:hypothetical protein
VHKLEIVVVLHVDLFFNPGSIVAPEVYTLVAISLRQSISKHRSSYTFYVVYRAKDKHLYKPRKVKRNYLFHGGSQSPKLYSLGTPWIFDLLKRFIIVTVLLSIAIEVERVESQGF